MTKELKDDAVTIPVVEEHAVVEKDKVATGKVRLSTTVHEDEVVVDEPFLTEQVTVERVPVDRWVDAPIPVRQEGNTTIVPLFEEVVVVEKRLKLIEEVHITKQQTTRHASQRVTLRRQEAVVERLPPSPAASADHAGTGPAPDTGAPE